MDDRPQSLRIGIDLGGTKTEAIALDRRSHAELARHRVATPHGSYDGTIRTIKALVEDLEGEHGTGTVGLGIPGAISPKTGLVKNANSTWLIGKPFDRDLAEALGRPVRIANDADCFALSEAVDGAGAGAPTVFGVILGTGVGGGIVVNGRPLSGPNAIAGEWGHNPLPWPTDAERPGPACYCGKSGCIETFLSGPGLARDHGGGLTAADIAALAEAGDPQAEAALARYEDRLARALATVIDVLDPHVIVLGGGVGNITRLYRTVPELWRRHVFSDAVATRLLPPVHGDSSGVRGAAWLWE
ncbi:MAG: ROK family protein [Solirubrobacterales bacterium]